MTPRERDPQVWAAAYGTAFVEAYREAFCLTDGPRETRKEQAYSFVDIAQCKAIADAAVMALHPDGTYTAPDGTVLREPVDEGPASDRV